MELYLAIAAVVLALLALLRAGGARRKSNELDQRFEEWKRSSTVKEADDVDLGTSLEGLRKNLSAIEVTLTGTLDAVSQVVVKEKGGDRTTMVFHEKKRDVLIPGPYFDLKDPRALDLEALLATRENAAR